jgi:pyruvate carboxylase
MGTGSVTKTNMYSEAVVTSAADPLPPIIQVICRGNTYLHAVQKMQRALYEFHIRGVKTNILFLENVLRHPEFLSGKATTSFIDRCAALQGIPTSSHEVHSCVHVFSGMYASMQARCSEASQSK